MTALTEHDYRACEASRWAGDERRCRWCNRRLRPHQALWCCLDCRSCAIENHALPTARRRIRLRRKCDICHARRFLQVHHIVPCNGTRTFSCAHHLSNLALLCQDCHRAQHQEAA